MPGLQKIPEDAFLGAIQKIGPVQPIDIRKELKQGESFLIGAMLSEFVSQGKLAISKTRRGNAPFYYFPDKPETLEKISQYLNEKDRRTCALLKEKSVLREDAVEPLTRVGLQNIFDFSRRFTLVENGAEIVYWRYYLVPEDEARKIIAGIAPAKESVDPPVENPKVGIPQSVIAEAQKIQEKIVEKIPSNEQKTEKPIGETIIGKPRKEAEKSVEIKMPSPALEKAKRIPRKKAVKKEAVQATLPVQDWTANDTLYEKVQTFAKEQKAVLSNPQSIKVHAELTCVLSADGPFGKISFSVVALNKKKIVEKDITSAVLSRSNGLPMLLLSVEEIPAKVVKTFSDVPNVYFRKL